MNELCRAEVFEFHRFLMKWYTDRDKPDKLLFTEFTDVLATDFRLVTPQGRIFTRPQLEKRVWDAYGVHAKDPVPFRVWVERFEGRPLGPDHHVVMYEEWQEVRGETRVRQSSAVFRKSDQSRNGVDWVHVHETWLAVKPATAD